MGSELDLTFLKGRRPDPITGVAVMYRPGEISYYDTVSTVADSFTYRKFIVEVRFAQKSFKVSVKTSEAKTAQDAVLVAARRAIAAYKPLGKPLGNLMSATVYEDTPEQRTALKIGLGYKGELWRGLAA